MAIRIAAALTIVLSDWASAVTGSVIECHRRFKLFDSEPTPPRECILDLGSKLGVKEGAVLRVNRSIPAVHSLSGETNDFVPIAVGELEVVSVGEHSSIVRFRAPRDFLPTRDFSALMVGDFVDVNLLPGF